MTSTTSLIRLIHYVVLGLVLSFSTAHVAAQWTVVSGSLAQGGNATFRYAGTFPDVSYTYWAAPPTYVAYVFKGPNGEIGWSGPMGGTPGTPVPTAANGVWKDPGIYTVEFWYLQNPSYSIFERKTLVSTYQFTVIPLRYTITTGTTGSGSGTVIGAGTYDQNSDVRVEAKPATSRDSFEGWAVRIGNTTTPYSKTENPLQFKIAANTTVIADFEQHQLIVDFSLQNTSQVFNEQPQGATIVPSDGNAMYTVTYSGNGRTFGPFSCVGTAAPKGPIDQGAYAVFISAAGDYTSATPNPVGTFTITRKPVTFAFGNTSNQYTGGTFAATATPSDPATTFTRNTSYGPGVGSYSLSADATGNYIGNGQATATVTPASVTFSFGNTSQTYTGGPLSASVTPNPANATYTASVSGGPNVGDYAISADGTGNFSGSARGTLTITKATPSVAWAAPAPITYGTALSAAQLNATTSVAGSFSYSPGAGTVLDAGTRNLTATFTPSDSRNYASVSASVTLTVQRKPVTFAFGALSATYDGAAKTATVSPSDPVATFSADVAKGPNAGSYAVNATATGNYTGTGTATLMIAPAPQTVTLTPASPLAVPGEPVTFHAAGGHTAYQWSGSAGASASGDSATATVSTPGTYTVTVRDPGSANYLPSNTATGTLQVAVDRKIVSFTPLESSYTVSDPTSPMNGQTYPRVWQSGGWVAYLGRPGVRFAVSARAAPTIRAIELQSRPPGAEWAQLASQSPAAGQSRVDATFSVMLGGTAPGQPLVPLSYYNGNPQTGTWSFRARVQDAGGTWSDFSPEVPVNVVLPITSRTLSGQTVPPAGPLGDWFTASPVQSYSFQFWVP